MDSPTRQKPIWMPPGGGVKLGESLEDALLREINEETGLQIEKKQLLWIHEFIEKPYHSIEFYFRSDVIGGELKKGIDPELGTDQQMLLDLSFVPFSEVKSRTIEPVFIKEFCENEGTFFKDVRHVVSSP